MLGPVKFCDLNHPVLVSLETLVPKNNVYRRLDKVLDLSFVRDWVKECYAGGGRPSVDPMVFFRLQLVMYLEGLRSERQLMRLDADRLSVRFPSIGKEIVRTGSLKETFKGNRIDGGSGSFLQSMSQSHNGGTWDIGSGGKIDFIIAPQYPSKMAIEMTPQPGYPLTTQPIVTVPITEDTRCSDNSSDPP
jgi:hypothetical protein